MDDGAPGSQESRVHSRGSQCACGGGVRRRAIGRGPLALLFGGEGSGIPPQAEDALDVRVAIPMAPGVESLSVNAAAAVLLFEAARKRRPL